MIKLEVFNTRIEASKRENYFKSGVGKEYLKHFNNAEVVELADTHDSKSCFARSEGSSPSFGTM